MEMRNKVTNQRGFGLLELVIALGIMGGIVLAVGQGMKLQNRSAAALDERVDVLGLRSLLLATLDCTYTLPADPQVNCTPGMYLDIVNASDKVMFPANGANGTPVGGLMVRAFCGTGRLEVEARHVVADGKKGTESWQKLFPKGLELCQGDFIPHLAGTGTGAGTSTGTASGTGTGTSTGTSSGTSSGTSTGTATGCPIPPSGNVCEEVGEYRFDFCISKGKNSRKCEKKERRIYKRCSKWAS